MPKYTASILPTWLVAKRMLMVVMSNRQVTVIVERHLQHAKHTVRNDRGERASVAAVVFIAVNLVGKCHCCESLLTTWADL